MTTDDRRTGQVQADADVRARLDAFAAARLTPDPTGTARTRAAVLAEARRLAAPAATATTGAGPSGRRSPRFRFALGPGLLAAALLVMLVGIGGVLAGAPGGPLYEVRLWAEQLTLPDQPAARVDAQLNRLDERLAEAEAAAEAGDGGAVAAALEAYRDEMADAVAVAARDAGTNAQVAARLEKHRAVLAALAERLPARAAEAILASVARTEATILEALGTIPSAEPDHPRASPQPGRTPPGKPEATPPGRPTQPEATPTPKPGKSPPGKPEETPKPDRSPPGKQATPTP